MSKQQWYFLDADNRVEPPKRGAYCIRCMKPLKKTSARWGVDIHRNGVWVRENFGPADAYLGDDCRKIVFQNNNTASQGATIKKGWDREGLDVSVVGPDVFSDQWWTPILIAGDPDPEFHKTAGIDFGFGDGNDFNFL